MVNNKITDPNEKKILSVKIKLIERALGVTGSNISSIEVGKNKLTKQLAERIECVYEHGGAEWLLTGKTWNKDYPVNSEMIEWLKDHPKEREDIWTRIKSSGRN